MSLTAEDKKILTDIFYEFIGNGDMISIQRGGFIVGTVDKNHYYLSRQDIENEANMRAYTKIANFLDELPKIEDTNKMYEIGWNDCINAILEEVDWEKKKIPSWCQLKPLRLPKLKEQVPLVIKNENDSLKEVYEYGVIDGYNECVREVLGWNESNTNS